MNKYYDELYEIEQNFNIFKAVAENVNKIKNLQDPVIVYEEYGYTHLALYDYDSQLDEIIEDFKDSSMKILSFKKAKKLIMRNLENAYVRDEWDNKKLSFIYKFLNKKPQNHNQKIAQLFVLKEISDFTYYKINKIGNYDSLVSIFSEIVKYLDKRYF